MTVMKYLSDVIWHILAEVTVKKWLVRLTERSEVLSIPVISVDSTLSVSIMMNWMHVRSFL